MSCTPNMTGCKVSCGHFAIVSDYRQERQRQEQVAEHASNGYRTEYEEHVQHNPLVTFKDWLIQRKREQ